MLSRSLTLGVFLLVSGPALAGPPTATPANSGPSNAAPAAGSIDALARALREYLTHHLPTVLYEKSPGWGHTKSVATGMKWTGKGLGAHVTHAERNDGKWRKIRVTAPNLGNTLALSIANVKQPEPQRTTFDVALAFDAQVDYELQDWKAGVRLYSGTARARLRFKLALACEATRRVEWQKGSWPEWVFRLRVLKANTSYENFILTHVAGVGGEAAKLIGDAVRDGIHKWHPAVERNLLARANTAIEKAGDSKEIRIGLGRLTWSKNQPAKMP